MTQFNKHDPFNQFRSGKTAKVVTEQELADQKARKRAIAPTRVLQVDKTYTIQKSDSGPICRQGKNAQDICRIL
jgi:hypothetical protein